MKLRIRRLVVATALFFTAITGARAEDDGVALGIGTAFRLFLEKAYATVLVGDPLVADVRTDDERIRGPVKVWLHGPKGLALVRARHGGDEPSLRVPEQ